MSKIKELKEAHPEFMLDFIQDLSTVDPSGTNKYLPFMVKTLQEYVSSYFGQKEYLEEFKSLIDLVKDFENLSAMGLIENKDIYSYENVEDIISTVTEAKEEYTNRQVKKLETVILFEDQNRILVKPLTVKSSQKYGANTEWCTSSTKSPNSFSEFAKEGVLLYLIFKHPPNTLPALWRKVAFNRKNASSDRTVWNAQDKQISVFDALKLFNFIGQEIMEIISYECDLCIPNMSLQKDDDGKIIVDEHLFTKSFYKEKQEEIYDYIRKLNQQNKDEKVKTFASSNETEEKTSGQVLFDGGLGISTFNNLTNFEKSALGTYVQQLGVINSFFQKEENNDEGENSDDPEHPKLNELPF